MRCSSLKPLKVATGVDFVKAHCVEKNPPSNPDRHHMQQMITTLVNWSQIETFLLAARREYNERWPPQRVTQAEVDAMLASNVWATDSLAKLADAELAKRLDLPLHQRLQPYSVQATLRYLFYHMRCGIYVMLRRNKVAMFVPFVNEDYRNNWGDHLRVEDGIDNNTSVRPPTRRSAHSVARSYYDRKLDEGVRIEYYLESRSSWWANGNLICNEHSTKGESAER